MTGTYPEYLLLQKGAHPPPDPHATGVRVYADTDGFLRVIQSDGTDAAIGSGDGSQNVLLASKTLNDDQIRALPSTRVEIVAAQGAGRVIVPLGAWFFCQRDAGAYTDTSDANLFIGTLTDEYPMLAEVDAASTGFGHSLQTLLSLGSVTRSFAWSAIETPILATFSGYSKAVTEPNSAYDIFDDEPLVIGTYGTGGVDFGGGDPANTLVVSVFYGILDLPT